MNNKFIYIIRHGETDFNKNGIVQGSGVDVDLNIRGIEQAQRFYEYYKHIDFQKIFISSLKRTFQTVKPFVDAGKNYTVVSELNEISWGQLEGKLQNAKHKEMYWHVVNQWKSGNYKAKLDGGESAEDLYNRLVIAARKIITPDLPENTLICMHGRALKAFLCLLLNCPLSEMDNFEHSNTCLYILRANSNNQFQIIKQNSIEHLLVSL